MQNFKVTIELKKSNDSLMDIRQNLEEIVEKRTIELKKSK